jgi:hypothetical protein
MKKWAHELNRKFSKEEYLKKFNFPGYERNANQNYTKISSHPS